ncbi:hypothetical protein HOE31_00575 [bacterium]|jgi:hypothetical protein|nr:hypothetical protein [bacterium]MBT4335239.1 hypothetical protein [bacterium]MBT4495670.1 hypothetical protein [bacterium]MBT4763808.1 hypothetical protein [bacterium]MBT5401178.1 hypothetical protein [bacterium]
MEQTWTEEYEEKKSAGDAVDFVVLQGKHALKVLMVKSETLDLVEKSGFDIVIRFTKEGLTHILTDLKREVDLSDLIIVLRIEEAKKIHLPFDKLNKTLLPLAKPHPGIDKWHYHKEKGMIQNISPTMLDPITLKQAIKTGINTNLMSPDCSGIECRGKKCDFYCYFLDRCKKNKKAK